VEQQAREEAVPNVDLVQVNGAGGNTSSAEAPPDVVPATIRSASHSALSALTRLAIGSRTVSAA
jgi:hypothetical protein